jgi:hypothetical protein
LRALEKGAGLLDIKHLIMLIKDIVGSENVKTDETMKNHTSFKIGGIADILVTPCDISSLIEVYKLWLCGIREFEVL